MDFEAQRYIRELLFLGHGTLAAPSVLDGVLEHLMECAFFYLRFISGDV